MRFVFYVNTEDSELIMTKKFVDNLDKFFLKEDKLLFVNTTGQTRIEALPTEEKQCCVKPKPLKAKAEEKKEVLNG